MRTIEDMVRMEVHYCVSSLVSTLAGADYEHGADDLGSLMDQAQELAASIDDWQEAAEQEGWSRNVGRMTGAVTYSKAGDTTAHIFEGWQDLCESEGTDAYQWEVFEHWIVSDWLADRLAEQGEKVDKDFAGLIVWARTTTGQAISMDSVIERIYAATHKADV